MQRKRFHLLAVAALALASAGCGSTATIDRFQTFADAGTQYTKAVDTLLSDTSGLLIDANSLKLLESRELAPVSEADFRKQDDDMRRQVKDLNLLQRQVDLLGEYFQTLGNLAGSSDSGQAGDEIADQLGNIGSSLSSLAKTLGSTDKLATDTDAVSTITKDVGKLVVQGVEVDALRKELEARSQTIADVLRQQADLLKALAEEAGRAQDFLNRRDYDQNVVDPFLASALPSSGWKSWMDERKKDLTKMPIPASLQDAVQAASNLRLAWVSLLANELDADDLEAVSQPLASIDARQSAHQGSNSSASE